MQYSTSFVYLSEFNRNVNTPRRSFQPCTFSRLPCPISQSTTRKLSNCTALNTAASDSKLPVISQWSLLRRIINHTIGKSKFILTCTCRSFSLTKKCVRIWKTDIKHYLSAFINTTLLISVYFDIYTNQSN